MNGFAPRAWRPAGLALMLGLTAGCSEKPASPTADSPSTGRAPATVSVPPAADPSSNEAEGMRSGSAPKPERVADTASAAPVDAVSLEAWNELLRPDLSPEAWEAARQTLLDRAAEAEPLLVRELASDDPYRRETAATLLGQSGVPSEKAQPALVRCLEDESPFVRANAAAALASVPDQAEAVIPVLTRLLRNDDPQLRKMAAVNLGSFGVEAALEVEALASALDDKDDEIVLPVVQLLGRIGQKAGPAMPKLQQIAFEQEGEIRKAAETAIEQIRTQEPGKD